MNNLEVTRWQCCCIDPVHFKPIMSDPEPALRVHDHDMMRR